MVIGHEITHGFDSTGKDKFTKIPKTADISRRYHWFPFERTSEMGP